MAVTTNWQYDLNGVTFGAGATLAGTGSTIAITEITGLDTPDANATITPRANAHGSFVVAKYRKERTVVLTGRVNSSAANYATDTYTLKSIFKVQDPAIPFTFRMSGSNNQYLNVYPQGVKYTTSNVATAVGWIDFQATMVAADPRIYDSTAGSQSIAKGATQSVTNSGTEYAPTTIVFFGPLTNPLLTNNTTGATFGLTQTISSGQSVTVDSLARTVYNGSTSQYSTITAGAKTFIELAPGSNSLTLTASSGTGTVTVNWHSTYF